ncbi:14120_t:CDS:2 [Funneliformis mosseae]|uniref:14120_t:CDS:1 n=1 Tax=Funneliformis mosseae TaxID=27381 RepID=A0A9N9GJF1_FUNMO|nr:14120_t:CDS:2 [Funneliformis mosseae]
MEAVFRIAIGDHLTLGSESHLFVIDEANAATTLFFEKSINRDISQGATADYLVDFKMSKVEENIKYLADRPHFAAQFVLEIIRLEKIISKQEVQGSLRIHFILPDLAETKDKSDRGGFRDTSDRLIYDYILNPKRLGFGNDVICRFTAEALACLNNLDQHLFGSQTSLYLYETSSVKNKLTITLEILNENNY